MHWLWCTGYSAQGWAVVNRFWGTGWVVVLRDGLWCTDFGAQGWVVVHSLWCTGMSCGAQILVHGDDL